MLQQPNPLETKCSAQQECRDGGDGVQLEVCLLDKERTCNHRDELTWVAEVRHGSLTAV